MQFASTDSVGRLGTKQCMAQLLVQSDHDICNNLFAVTCTIMVQVCILTGHGTMCTFIVRVAAAYCVQVAGFHLGGGGSGKASPLTPQLSPLKAELYPTKNDTVNEMYRSTWLVIFEKNELCIISCNFFTELPPRLNS